VNLPRIAAFRFEILLVTGLCLAGVAVHCTNLWLEDHIAVKEIPGEVGLLPDGKMLRVASLGFDRLVADLFWLRTVNYIGDERAAKVGYPAAQRLVELVTDVDPEFRTAYSVMNTVLTVLSPQVDAAIALLEKGIHHIAWWKLHFLQGYNYFHEKGDYRRAAEQIRLAATLPGGPPYLPRLAARLYASGGDPDAALQFVLARIDYADSEPERRKLIRRARDLRIVRDLRELNRAIEAYAGVHDGPPSDIALLVEAGFISAEPRDPEGGVYRIENGVAVTSLEYDDQRVHIN
jgi:hypothetical protein